MSQGQKISLADLVNLYNSEEVQSNQVKREQTLPLIFTHEEIKPALRNQSQIIRKIFTYENVSTLIGYLKSENKGHAELLKTIKFDPSGESVPLCLKLPFMAMEILTCQCQIINELLFQGSAEQSLPPLLPQLLAFLDQPEHYLLASYFSRVICAITKRVSSSGHKYNAYFSQWIFGSQEGAIQKSKSILYKSINHLYSLTVIEFITKWLLISSKVKVKQQLQGQIFQKVVIQFRRSSKHQFLIDLIQHINSSSLSPAILNNIPPLFEQLLTQTQKSNKIATSLMIKSLPQIPTGPKITLYDLAVNQQVINQIFKPHENSLNLAKINLIKVYIKRYINELATLQKNSEEDGDKELKMLQILSNDQFITALQWMFQQLKTLLNISKTNNKNETSPVLQQQQIEQSRIKATPTEKMIILQLLEVLRLIHNIQNLRPQLIEYYDANSSDLVKIIKRVMSLQNNLLQLQTSKLVLVMLKSNKKLKDQLDVPCDFARKLLTVAITQLIELETAQCHVIEWADIILSLQSKHIFQNYEQEFEWDHIREIVQNVKRINVGEYRLIQGNIDCFYSTEKALLKYSNFLNDFKVEIVYEQKKQVKEQNLSSKKLLSASKDPPIKQQSDQINQPPLKPIQLTFQFIQSDKQGISNPFGNNYLSYDVNDLINQI